MLGRAVTLQGKRERPRALSPWGPRPSCCAVGKGPHSDGGTNNVPRRDVAGRAPKRRWIGEGRAAARDRDTTDREGGDMGTRDTRRAGRFQVEALEARWTPGGAGGHGGDIPRIYLAPHQAHVALPEGGLGGDPAAAPSSIR